MTAARRALAVGLALTLVACHQEGSGKRRDGRDDDDAAGELRAESRRDARTSAASARADVGPTASRDGSAGGPGGGGDAASSPTGPAPEPGARELVQALEPGIVSKDLVGDCAPIPATRDLAALAARCLESPDAATCRDPLPVGVVGFHEDGRVAVLSAPWLPACGEAASYRAFEATLPFLHHDDFTSFSPSEGARAEPAALAWASKRLARGFAPARDVARFACEYERWLSPVRGLTLLREPLDGWMLVVGRGRKTLPVRLVGPSNKRVWDLDPIELRPGTHCEPDEKKKGSCVREVGGEVVQLVLSPNRRALIATLAIGTGERCGAAHIDHRTFRLPDGVRSILPKPLRGLDHPSPDTAYPDPQPSGRVAPPP